jgi:parallel beta-helix repeat protein
MSRVLKSWARGTRGLALLVVPLVVVGSLAAGCTSGPPAGGPAGGGPDSGPPAAQATVCGTPVLNSPFSYHGSSGPYRSGVAGLPTYGTPGSDFPGATAGAVLPPGTHSYFSYQLAPKTVYYLLPGTHVGSFQANAGDAFVGGRANGQGTIVSGNYSATPVAFDSNYSTGNAPGVTIEYLTIEKFRPNADAAAINQSSNTGWTLRYNTITLNVPGAGAIAGADNTLEYNCMTLNGQYGFQSSGTGGTWGLDSVTGGPYNVTIAHNEISYNDTCDFEGLLDNAAIGWSKHNPVPAQYRNPHCGTVTGDGNQGGFKLWETNGVTVKDNNIHDNWGPGAWVDTDNANTTFTGNRITGNDGEAIIEEISYNFAITGNYIADNAWAIGLNNPKFPNPAIYVSESGSLTGPGAIPACGEPSCAGQPSHPGQSIISGNTLVDNGAGILLWQNSDRHCSSGFDHACTLAGGDPGGYSIASCQANLPTASIDPTTFTGRVSGSPARDWWDGCLWKTANVHVTGNAIKFQPGHIPNCTEAAWPDCGANGIFSEYSVAPPYTMPGAWVILSQLTFFQGNTWSDNVYNGPSTFYAWNQGNGDNPVSWANWTGSVASGDKCGSQGEHASGACAGPFGQDAGSSYHG